MFTIKNILFVLLVLSVGLTSCDKNKFTTKPQIKISKYAPDNGTIPVPQNSQNSPFSIELSFTDKEGDISDTLWIQKVRTNKKPLPSGTEPTISKPGLKIKVPSFDGSRKGEIRYDFMYQGQLAPAGNENDTVYFRFVLKDLKGNISDTLDSKQIIILK